MFSWIEPEILGLPGLDYNILLGVMCVGLIFLVYYAFGFFKRFRFMDAIATSTIRSAAQGHIELKGRGEWLPNDTIRSPFSNSRCVWYHCTIDERNHGGKRTTWTNITDECSSHLFRLVDDSGHCIVDPDDAQVIPETDITWYGGKVEACSRPPKSTQWISLGVGNYRFRERLIRPATSVYALGSFRSFHSNPSDEFITKKVEDLVKQWKLQPQRYLRDFDLNQNDKIQKDEWKVIDAAARKQVLAKINLESQAQHVLSRPEDKRHPYILSAQAEEILVTRKKWKAYGSVGAAFMVFVALVIMFSIRSPLPV